MTYLERACVLAVILLVAWCVFAYFAFFAFAETDIAKLQSLVDEIALEEQCDPRLTFARWEPLVCIRADHHAVLEMSADRKSMMVINTGWFTDLAYFEGIGLCVKAYTDPVLWCRQGERFVGMVRVEK